MTEIRWNWDQPVRKGWQCPICSRVYSPDTTMCFVCPPKPTSNEVFVDQTGPVEPPNECPHFWQPSTSPIGNSRCAWCGKWRR